MPEHDVYTEHDPREPVVGHARVDDDVIADPDAEPVAGDTMAGGSGTTYESAAHDRHDEPDDSYVEDGAAQDSTSGRAMAVGTEDPTGGGPADDRPAVDFSPALAQAAEHAQAAEKRRAADEALAGEDGFGDRPAEDTAFRARTADDAAFDHEARRDPAPDHVTDASDLTYTGDAADLSDADADDTDVVDDAAAAVTVRTAALPVHPQTGTAVDQTLTPGAVRTAPFGKLWTDADVDGLRGRWRELQLRFIDDPREVAGEAERLVTEAVDALAAALTARKDALSDWRDAGGDGADTERLRTAVRRYRDLFDQLLDL